MPIYEYRCVACGKVSEIFQGMGDKDDLLHCKFCGSDNLDKILSPTAFSLKGDSDSNAGLTCCEKGVSCDNPKRCCQR